MRKINSRELVMLSVFRKLLQLDSTKPTNKTEISVEKLNSARERAAWALEEHLGHDEVEANKIVSDSRRTYADFQLIKVMAPMLNDDLRATIDSFYEENPNDPATCKEMIPRLIDRFPEEPVILNSDEQGATVHEEGWKISKGLVGSLVRSRKFKDRCEEQRVAAHEYFLSVQTHYDDYSINYGSMLSDPRAQLALAFIAALMLFALRRPIKCLSAGISAGYRLFDKCFKPKNSHYGKSTSTPLLMR